MMKDVNHVAITIFLYLTIHYPAFVANNEGPPGLRNSYLMRKFEGASCVPRLYGDYPHQFDVADFIA